jgi:hypothetical protein
LVREHDVLSQEDVQTASLLRNQRLAKRLQAAGWSAFLSMLAFPAAGASERSSLRARAGAALAAARWSPQVCLFADAPPAERGAIGTTTR